MERKKTCCFTGHRPQQLGFAPGSAAETALKNRLAGEILRLIEEQNVRRFISGMALGVDTWAAQTVLKLKEIYPDLTLECAVPCRTQAKYWSRRDRETYLPAGGIHPLLHAAAGRLYGGKRRYRAGRVERQQGRHLLHRQLREKTAKNAHRDSDDRRKKDHHG